MNPKTKSFQRNPKGIFVDVEEMLILKIGFLGFFSSGLFQSNMNIHLNILSNYFVMEIARAF